MKNKLAWVLCLLAVGFPLKGEGEGGVPLPPGPYDLRTCYDLAVLQSETLGMGEEDIRVAQARYWQAVSAILPKAHAIATESVQSHEGGSFGSSDGFSGNEASRKDHLALRINVKQPIFSGFRDAAVQSARKAITESKKQDLQRNRQLLYLEVSEVFYQVLMYESGLALMDEALDSLQKRVLELERRAGLGRSRAGEVMAARYELADARAARARMEGLLGATRELFSFQTGLPVKSIQLKDSLSLPTAETLEVYLAQSGERPDILAAIQQERAERKTLTAVKGEHWPVISAEGNYYLKEEPRSQRDWNILLTVDLPLFEGGLVEARIREQKAVTKASQLSLDQLRRTAAKDVKVAYQNFLSSMGQAASLQELARVAEENHRVQSRDFQRGVASHLDELWALNQWQDARRRLMDAQMEARSNLIRLHVTAGAVQP